MRNLIIIQIQNVLKFVIAMFWHKSESSGIYSDLFDVPMEFGVWYVRRVKSTRAKQWSSTYESEIYYLYFTNLYENLQKKKQMVD